MVYGIFKYRLNNPPIVTVTLLYADECRTKHHYDIEKW
jgi:hypothetical protein